jgi:hypothetical protein
MIIEAEIMSQPYSGDYTERIYDNESPWNSQSWTFIKFVNDDHLEWCGQFRGFSRQVAISKSRNIVLVLTSDYLFQLDRETGNLSDLEGQPQYKNLMVSPKGDFLLSDDYTFERVTISIKDKESIESPIQMDMIKFGSWDGTNLEFTCDEFTNWKRHLTMTYDSQENKIVIKGG